MEYYRKRSTGVSPQFTKSGLSGSGVGVKPVMIGLLVYSEMIAEIISICELKMTYTVDK